MIIAFSVVKDSCSCGWKSGVPDCLQGCPLRFQGQAVWVFLLSRKHRKSNPGHPGQSRIQSELLLAFHPNVNLFLPVHSIYPHSHISMKHKTAVIKCPSTTTGQRLSSHMKELKESAKTLFTNKTIQKQAQQNTLATIHGAILIHELAE